VPVGLLKEAWGAGRASRLTVLAGLGVSIIWGCFVAAVAVGFIVSTVRDGGLPSAYKVPLLTVFAVVVLVLVIPLPAQWLMYLLLRLDQRRRRAGAPRPQ